MEVKCPGYVPSQDLPTPSLLLVWEDGMLEREDADAVAVHTGVLPTPFQSPMQSTA